MELTKELEIAVEEEAPFQPNNKYLSNIQLAYDKLDRLDENYVQTRERAKRNLAFAIDEAKTESDLTVSLIATHFGKSRQAINKVLTDVFGVRHIEKSEAAKLGHTKESRENVQ